jgi:hypothetical protein
MAYQNISYEFTQQDFDAIMAALETLTTKMPFLITMDPKDVKAVFKLGPGSADFAQDAYAAALAFPQILPPSFDVAEFGKDSKLFKQLLEVSMVLDSIQEKVADTQRAVGGEAMTACLEMYAYVQTAKDRVPGLRSVADKLADRFKKQGKKAKRKPPTDMPPPPLHD